MLLMKVFGCRQRGVSTTKSTMVGKVEAKASVTICPEADHVKISICPGVSAMMYFGEGSFRFSQSPITCMKPVAQSRCKFKLHTVKGCFRQQCCCGQIARYSHITHGSKMPNAAQSIYEMKLPDQIEWQRD